MCVCLKNVYLEYPEKLSPSICGLLSANCSLLVTRGKICGPFCSIFSLFVIPRVDRATDLAADGTIMWSFSQRQMPWHFPASSDGCRWLAMCQHGRLYYDRPMLDTDLNTASATLTEMGPWREATPISHAPDKTLDWPMSRWLNIVARGTD